MEAEGGDAAVAGGVLVVAVAAITVAPKTDHTSSILAFVGVLLVALITAYTASRRQRTGLAAEAERHAATLNAEEKRLEAQLGHERRMSDIADLRLTLEDALAASDAIGDIAYQINDGSFEDDAHAAFEQQMRAFAKTIDRLQIRLPDDDPILRAHRDLHDSLNTLADSALEGKGYGSARQPYFDAYRGIVEAAKPRLRAFTD
jgi:hypothetical protein